MHTDDYGPTEEEKKKMREAALQNSNAVTLCVTTDTDYFIQSEDSLIISRLIEIRDQCKPDYFMKMLYNPDVKVFKLCDEYAQIDARQLLYLYKNHYNTNLGDVWFLSSSCEGALMYLNYRDTGRKYDLDFLSGSYFFMKRESYHKVFGNKD